MIQLRNENVILLDPLLVDKILPDSIINIDLRWCQMC